MKKYLTISLFYFCLSNLFAQTNLITNPGFDTNTSSFLVNDAGTAINNQLQRVNSIVDATTATTLPAATSVSVTDGLWLKKMSFSASNMYCQLSNSSGGSGNNVAGANSTTNCMFLKIGGGNGTVGIDWTKFATQQRLALDNTKKYTFTFYAKASGDVGTLTCVAYIADKTGNYVGNISGVPFYKTFTPTSSFVKYTATFDLAAAKVANSNLDFSTAYVGIGWNPTYDATNKTKNSYLYIDELSLSESSTPVISSSTSSVTNLNPFPVTITFNNPVTGFTSSDLVITNGTVDAFSGSGATYTANIIPTGEGAVTVNIPAAAATDGLSNATLAATQFSRTYDITAPTVAILSTETATTSANPIPVTITFSEAVTGFDATDIVVGNGTASNFVVVSGSVYTADITPAAFGVVTVDIAAGVAQDAATNGNTAATQFTRTYADQATPISKPSAIFKLYAKKGQIIIENNSSKSISIFNTTGQLVKTLETNSGYISIPVSKGLYIVKSGEEVHTVMVE